MSLKTLITALLLAGSGFCALIYQVVWLREFRLVFGGSTSSSAAVLAIFMAGLGIGAVFWGKRVDRLKSPLALYGVLEIFIAITCALSPYLLDLVRSLYVFLGGSMVLGIGAATMVRLVLSCLVIAIPTFLMGGTLPAVVRAVMTDEDVRRAPIAILYGANTLGAVLGTCLSNFYLIEALGNQMTLLAACTLNGIIAIAALAISYTWIRPIPDSTEPSVEGSVVEREAPASYVLFSAGVIGFAFLLMELVWYRMLVSILGGTTYAFGLILAVALLGIGVGSIAYPFVARVWRPTLNTFALTVSLEALFLMIPYAAGDRIALLALALREWSEQGFYGLVMGWAVVTATMVFVPALISGFQFPLLVALLGRGREDVGRQTGYAYASNTAGAILGSLAGGFGAIPLLGAVGAWKATGLLLVGLAAISLLMASGRTPRKRLLVPGAVVGLVTVYWTVFAVGPTAVWRHSEIGVGRGHLDTSSPNLLKNSELTMRRITRWETDGIESSVSIVATSGISFVINGKNDGNARWDAPTQVMFGMITGLLHPEPKDVFVVGFGTGSSAGWLAAIDTVEKVDVAELEPAVIEIAARSAIVNHDALNNPKINIFYGDAREHLLTAPDTYDLIVSEPSNPFRAGISSLYTTEFYQAIAEHLNEGGLFSQWVQTWDIDEETFMAIYATLKTAFPYVEIWQTNHLDAALVCGKEPITYSKEWIEKRLAQSPFAEAALRAWRVTDAEGFLAHYIANEQFLDQVEGQYSDRINTDDKNLVEYAFARSVGRGNIFSAQQVRAISDVNGTSRPLRIEGDIDWRRVEAQRVYIWSLIGSPVNAQETFEEWLQPRIQAVSGYAEGDLAKVASAYATLDDEISFPVERVFMAEALAEQGSSRTLEVAREVEDLFPVETQAILARYYARTGDVDKAMALLESVFFALQEDPWPMRKIMERSLMLAQQLVEPRPDLSKKLIDSLESPFSVLVYEELRLWLLSRLYKDAEPSRVLPYLESLEPNPIWDFEYLKLRESVYQSLNHPLASAASKDLSEYLKNRFARD